MELVAPAGNLEKLKYAYTYGADAVYIGLKKFSLRIKADNFYEDEYKTITELKKQFPGKKLFCALNISFHNKDIDNFLSELEYFRAYPIDSFIVQDIGMVPVLQKNFPNAALHLSTQANCINREAVKMYKSLGFKRVVLGRETSLAEIREIKDYVPEMELECFAHGAMCISYSGRCLMSAYLTGRSANAGFCSHTCRWNFNVAEAKDLAESGKLYLTEEKRKDEHFPVFEGENFTAVLSSKDLCMIDHLDDMKKAGVDSLKIEGRMKSLYYVAMTTRAYRKAIDAQEGRITKEDAAPYIAELYKASHREFGTGFYYSREDADVTTVGESSSDFELAATIGAPLSDAETQALCEKGAALEAQFKARLDAMHPEAKAAKLKDYADHPDKVPHACCCTGSGSAATTAPTGNAPVAAPKLYVCNALNRIDEKTYVEYVGPDCTGIPDTDFRFVDPETGCFTPFISHNQAYYLYTDKPVQENWIIRTRAATADSSRAAETTGAPQNRRTRATDTAQAAAQEQQ